MMGLGKTALSSLEQSVLSWLRRTHITAALFVDEVEPGVPIVKWPLTECSVPGYRRQTVQNWRTESVTPAGLSFVASSVTFTRDMGVLGPGVSGLVLLNEETRERLTAFSFPRGRDPFDSFFSVVFVTPAFKLEPNVSTSLELVPAG